jgi:hypothetical protein
VDLRPTVTGHRAKAPADVRGVVDIVGARVFVDVTIPRTTIKGRLRLCSRKEEFAAKAEARAAMLEAGYPVNAEAHTALGATEQWLAEVMVRMLAIAVRMPGDEGRPLASLEDWQECDDQQLMGLWSIYQDQEHALDPLGVDTLTDAELAALIAAAKKKDADSLMAFGSHRLALFAITSASPPASSETPTSSSGPSPTPPPT